MNTTIDLSALPETYEIKEEDRFYVFSKRNGTWIKNEIGVNDLSNFFYEKDIAGEILEKYNQLLRLSAEFISFLEENYPDRKYISANFSTKAYFNDVFKTIETTDSVSTYLIDYVTKDYGAYAKAQALKEHEKFKLAFQKDSSLEVLGQIDTNY